jgi:hypothetical protein
MNKTSLAFEAKIEHQKKESIAKFATCSAHLLATRLKNQATLTNKQIMACLLYSIITSLVMSLPISLVIHCNVLNQGSSMKTKML